MSRGAASVPLPLLASSDIIESLFGNFKDIIGRGPQADMNRSALLIPVLCGCEFFNCEANQGKAAD